MNEQISTWEDINSSQDIDGIIERSMNQPVVIFKYSMRCGVSFSASDSLTEVWDEEHMKPVHLTKVDVIGHRSVSLEIAQRFGVIHQSPQLLVIWKGESIHDVSHFRIHFDNLKKIIEETFQTNA